MYHPHTRQSWNSQLRLIKDTAPLDPTGHLLYKATLPRLGNIEIYLIYRNKHRQVAKMGIHRHVSQIKQQE